MILKRLSFYRDSIVSGKANLIGTNNCSKIYKYKKTVLSLNFEIDKLRLNSILFKDKEIALTALQNNLRNIFYIDRSYYFPVLIDEIYSQFADKNLERKSILPVNTEIINKIEDKVQIKFNKFLSNFFWYINLFSIFFKSAKLLVNVIIKNLKKSEYHFNNSSYFDVEGKFEELSLKENAFFILNAFKKVEKTDNFFLKKSKINTVIKKNSSNQYYQNDIFPPLQQGSYKLVKWYFYTLYLCLKDLLFKNWTSMFMLHELLCLKIFELSDKKFYHENYIFSYQGMISRSMWTYYLEKYFNKKIWIFFYSTNTEPYKIKNLEPTNPDAGNWSYLPYNNYLVWNEIQESIIRSRVSNVRKIKILGPILNKLENINKNNFNNRYISVFDISPENDEDKLFLGNDIIKANNVIKFHEDILEVANNNNIHLVIRIKKDAKYNLNLNSKYLDFLSKIKENKNVILLNRENSSLVNILNNSLGCISFPFTTVAVIAKYLNIKSAYYDPSQMIENISNRVTNGVNLLKNKEELNKFISSLR